MTEWEAQHRVHRDAALLDAHRRVLTAAAGGDADEVVAALARVRGLREALDRTEHELLTLARRREVSWARAATALGLRSRQAAEQRAARLSAQLTAVASHDGCSGTATEGCPCCRDTAADGGPSSCGVASGAYRAVVGTASGGCCCCADTGPIAELRDAARAAWLQLVADPAWDGAYPRAALTRGGLAAAVDAPQGALYALVAQAVDDLDGVALDGRPVLLRAAVARLRESFRAATPERPGVTGRARRPPRSAAVRSR